MAIPTAKKVWSTAPFTSQSEHQCMFQAQVPLHSTCRRAVQLGKASKVKEESCNMIPCLGCVQNRLADTPGQ